MDGYSDIIRSLINELTAFPGIGPKSAERMVFYLLRSEKKWAYRLSDLIKKVKEDVFFCKICHNLSESSVCRICGDDTRDKSLICVVEEPKDVIFVENTKSYNGLYHVLLGALSPLNGIGPSDLKIKELLNRVETGGIEEIILATNCNAEGEATAFYLQKILKPFGIKITRIACGVPKGSNLEYVDSETLARAVSARVDISEFENIKNAF